MDWHAGGGMNAEQESTLRISLANLSKEIWKKSRLTPQDFDPSVAKRAGRFENLG